MSVNQEEVLKTLEKIRPYIQRDGGDVEFVKITDDDIVIVRMLGACANCMSLDDTLTEGIQAILMDEVPGVKGVQMEDPLLSMFGE